jgi:hypothetical protein
VRRYFIALHEIGHIVLGHPDFTPWRQGLEVESAAWRFALEQASALPDSATIEEMRVSLEGYREGMLYWAMTENVKPGTLELPEVDDLVAELLDRSAGPALEPLAAELPTLAPSALAPQAPAL